MSILDSIKGTRKMSFGHWRYRLLHWCFNVKNPDPKNVYDTGLPKFLYTHYCPLFHLTNLIAILSPLILFIKVTAVVVGAIAYGMSAIPWGEIREKISKALAWIKLPKREKAETPAVVETPKRTKAHERRLAVEAICDTPTGRTFGDFWYTNSDNYETLTREEVEAVFLEYMPKVIEARERARLRKERLRARLVFWTNFSQVFIKWFLNAFYFALTGGALYLLYVLAGPVSSGLWSAACWVVDGIGWLCSDSGFFTILLTGLKYAFYFAVLAGGLYVLARVGFLQRFGEALLAGLKKLTPPFYLLGRFGAWVGGGFTGVVEFVKMFYEENCPPIVLVTPEDEKVEQVAEGEDHKEVA